MVGNLRPSLTPHMDVTEDFRREVFELTKYTKVFKAAHVKYITEEDDVDLKETAKKEYHNAVENAYDLLFPSAPDLEEIMADVEKQIQKDLDYLRKLDFLKMYEDDKETHTMQTKAVEVDNKAKENVLDLLCLTGPELEVTMPSP